MIDPLIQIGSIVADRGKAMEFARLNAGEDIFKHTPKMMILGVELCANEDDTYPTYTVVPDLYWCAGPGMEEVLYHIDDLVIISKHVG